MDCFEEFLAGFLELLRGLVVADLERNGVEYCKAQPGLQAVLGAGE